MELDKIIFLLIEVVIILIFLSWMFSVFLNIYYEILLIRYRKKININIFKRARWLIGNAFLFESFKKDFHKNYESEFRDKSILDKRYLKILYQKEILLKYTLRMFNTVFAIIFIMLISMILIIMLILILRLIEPNIFK